MRIAPSLVALALGAGALTATACGSSSGSPPATTATTTAAAPSGTGTGGSAAVARARVSANTSTQQELVSALTAAGVGNASRWAREIEEYRPYDTGDASLAKLRKELQKYNPGTETLDKIMSVLQP